MATINVGGVQAVAIYIGDAKIWPGATSVEDLYADVTAAPGATKHPYTDTFGKEWVAYEFPASSTITFSKDGVVDTLIVAGGGNGGGGGGQSGGGGGGAGGALLRYYASVSAGPQTVTVGGATQDSSLGANLVASAGANAGGAGAASGAPTTHTGGATGQDASWKGGGGGGGAGGNGGDGNYWGGAAGAPLESDIIGTKQSYAEGGAGGSTTAQGQSGQPGAQGRYPGSGGGGGGTANGAATPGRAGVIVVRVPKVNALA